MKEVLLDPPKSLTMTLDLLNKIFIGIDCKTDKNKKVFLKNLKIIVTQKTAIEAWEYVCKQVDPHLAIKDIIIIDSTDLFQYFNLSPYIGEKKHGVMFCQGMVIGLKLALGDNANISYRLDFDPNKELHINFEIFDNGDRYPFCIPLNFSTGKYGFSLKDKESCKTNDDKRLSLLELTKVKFWLKMTIGYRLSIINKNPTTPNRQHDTQPLKNQLFSFIQGSGDYSFNSIKNYIIDMIPGKKGREEIRMCESELALLECINKKPVIRSRFRHTMFAHISEQDKTGRLLEGLHHNHDVEQFIDSETREESEQPPNSVF